MEKGLERTKLRKQRRKKKRNTLTLCIIIAAVVIVTVINPLLRSFRRGTVTVEIPEGASTAQIAGILQDSDVINSRLWFLFRLAVSEYSGKLQYGTFKFDRSDSMGEILNTLATKGAQKKTVRLTIPEGFSVEKIKERVCEMGLCTDREFEAALKKDYDFSFLSSVPKSKDINYRLQGFLYPSTYEFYSDASAETVIETMLAEFEKQIKPLGIPEDKLYETVTKASMIEREAKLDEERAVIAGVFENRLKAGMKLQIDATVVYAVSDGMYDLSRVLYKHLEVDSKYNTYKYDGLPVGPICCPSAASVKAAANPAKHDYLYYHTDTNKNDGSHVFTVNFEEHTASMK